MKIKSDMMSIPVRTLSRAIISLPLFGLFFSVVWSILFDFESSTATHCNVYNFLPSVSASIARRPQAYVWKICIALHCAPRYMMTYIYYIWYSQKKFDITKLLSSIRSLLIYLTPLGNLVELSALLGLSMISSTDNHAVHETCFILFVVGSLACMISACLLNSIIIVETEFEQKLMQLKHRIVAFYIISFLLSICFFFRHNAFCEPGVYSLFALLEYLVIVSNVYFHYCCALDVGDHYLCLNKNDTFKV